MTAVNNHATSAISGALANLNLNKEKHEASSNGTNGTSSSAAAKAAALNSNNHHGSNSTATAPDSNKLSDYQQRGGAVGNGSVDKPQAVAPIRPKVKEIDGYVGFASLPDQVYRKAVKKGFEFTLMVVGESGLGKSTLINSMFLSDIYNQEQYPGPSHRIKKTVAVETTKVLLKENGVNLTLTVVDTPGFGDAVDNSNW